MNELDAAAVKAYLQNNPDFFHHHEDLLEQISIPHSSGRAVSLITKQLDIFRRRHQELETQLDSLTSLLKDNDNAVNKMHELTLAVLEADTLEMAIENLYVVLAECFLADFLLLKLFVQSRVSHS